MRKVFVIANWKMNPVTMAEAKRLFRAVARGVKRAKGVEVIICPPFVYLSSFKFQVSGLKIGAQDCFWEQKGAYTGEISPLMLKNLGCEYVIVGHSERRRHLCETDAVINQKLKMVLACKMKPILCVGETKEERDRGLTRRTLQIQLKTGLRSILKSQVKKVIIAYEPVWAIGTSNACSFQEGAKVLEFMRKILKKISGSEIAKSLPVIYGGSVNSSNAAGYIKKSKFQGLLVGGASLDAPEFIKIIIAPSQ